MEEELKTISELVNRARSGDEEALQELCSLVPAPAKSPDLIVADKLKAAKHQLQTAITLFFADGDAISIHTLACAAHSILRNLNGHRGGKPMLTQKADHELIYAAGNFFKHAKDDPDDFLRFRPQVSLFWLVDALLKYEELANERVLIFSALWHWFVLSFPTVAAPCSVSTELQDFFSKQDRPGFLELFLRTHHNQPPSLGSGRS